MPDSKSNLLWGPQTTIKNTNWLYFGTAATSKDWLTSIWTAGKPLPGIWTFCWSDYKNPTSFLRTISRNNVFDKGGTEAWGEKSIFLFYEAEDEFSVSNSSVLCPVAKVRILKPETLENCEIWNPWIWSQESSPLNSESTISFLNCFTWAKAAINIFYLSIYIIYLYLSIIYYLSLLYGGECFTEN